MPYTPYATLTDREFSTFLANIEDPSDTEVESMERIDRLLQHIEDLEDGLIDEATHDPVIGTDGVPL